MVDLVKIRKKANDAKSETPDAPDKPAEMAAQAEPTPEPAGGKDAVAVPDTPPPPAEPEPAPVVETKAEPAGPAPPRATQPQAKAKAAKKSPPPDKPAPPAEPEPPAVAASEPAVAPAPAERETPPPPSDADEPEDRLERFKRIAGTRRSWSETTRAGEAGEADAATQELELLRFTLSGEDYAVDIDKIVEIVPPRSTTRVPNAHETIVGIISLRGTIVTVLDLRRKLGHPPKNGGDTKDARMIVVERAGETAGFLVDRVSRVIKLDPSQLESHPVVSSAEQSEYVSGVFQAADGLVILLDLEKILAG